MLAGALLLILFILFIFTPILALWEGWVISHLWLWFVVPIFNLPTLRPLQAAGIALVVGIMTHQTVIAPDDPDGKKTIMAMVNSFLHPLMVLIIGWIIHAWM